MPSTLEEYEVLYTIGTGSYGTCKKIRRKKDGKILVWKELDYGTMTETEKTMLVSEVNLLRELKHQHIVRYYDRIIDRSNTTLYIIMEYCEGGDLSSYISKLKREGRPCEEEFVWRMCYQMVLALKECHSRQKNGKAVLHRDLKPANVFLDHNNCVKLGDFGLARVLNHETSFAKTFVGTPYYMSPEQMNYSTYNEKSDIWSLGCLLYELCALRPPFTASSQQELATKICCGRFARLPARYSDSLNDLIGSMLIVDETKRHTIEHLLRHPQIARLVSHAAGVQRSSSTASDEETSSSSSSSDPKSDSLKQREEALAAREKKLLQLEKDLAQREKALEARETSAALQEKLAAERIARAERMLKDYQAKMKALELSSAAAATAAQNQNAGVVPSILCKGPRLEDSPKKHVTFDQENKWYSLELSDRLGSAGLADKKSKLSDCERRIELEQATRMMELRHRLKTSKFRSDDVRTSVDTNKFRGHPLLGMR